MKRIRLLCAGVMHLTDFLLYAAFAVCRQRNLLQKLKLYERLKANIGVSSLFLALALLGRNDQYLSVLPQNLLCFSFPL